MHRNDLLEKKAQSRRYSICTAAHRAISEANPSERSVRMSVESLGFVAGVSVSDDLQRPLSKQKLHDITLMRLQPIELNRGDRTKIQSIDENGIC